MFHMHCLYTEAMKCLEETDESIGQHTFISAALKIS